MISARVWNPGENTGNDLHRCPEHAGELVDFLAVSLAIVGHRIDEKQADAILGKIGHFHAAVFQDPSTDPTPVERLQGTVMVLRGLANRDCVQDPVLRAEVFAVADKLHAVVLSAIKARGQP